MIATCPWLALPGPPQAIPRHPYLNRRCGPGAGGPCSRWTTGRSGSGRGDLGPRVASAGQERPGREPRARGPDPPLPPPPGRLAGPGTSQGSHRLPPSALGSGRERAQAGWGRRRGLSCPLRPRVEPPAGWQGGEAAASSGAQRGRRKNTEKFAQEGAAYSRLSLPPVTDTGPPSLLPSVPGNLPGCSTPRRGPSTGRLGSVAAGPARLSQPGLRKVKFKLQN